MKMLVCSALALPLTAVVGWASDDDWANLDHMAEELAASLDNGAGPTLGGFIITSFWSSSDVMVAGPGSNDLGGFALEHARAHVSGNQGDWAYYLDYNFADSSLKDATIRVPVSGSMYVQAGNYRPPVLRSSHVYRPNVFFADRSAAGSAFASRDLGAQVGGNFDIVEWAFSVQNGDDAAGSDFSISARVEANVLGDGVGPVEGSQGGTDSPSATVGLAAWQDDGIKTADTTAGDAIAADFHVATNVYSAGIEILDIGGENGDGFIDDGSPLTLILEGDSTPISLQGTYMIVPDQVEGGVRYTKSDNFFDDKSIEFGVRKYWDGHRATVGLFYTILDSDISAREVDLLGVDIVLAF
jgi:hypothetical protein